MLNDERETPGAALYRLGYSINTTSKEQLDEAEAELKKQKPLLRGYFDSTQNRPSVVNGDLLLGHVFSGTPTSLANWARTSTTLSPSQRRRAGRTTWLSPSAPSTPTTPTSS